MNQIYITQYKCYFSRHFRNLQIFSSNIYLVDNLNLTFNIHKSYVCSVKERYRNMCCCFLSKPCNSVSIFVDCFPRAHGIWHHVYYYYLASIILCTDGVTMDSHLCPAMAIISFGYKEQNLLTRIENLQFYYRCMADIFGSVEQRSDMFYTLLN